MGGCEVGGLIWILGYKDAERMGEWGRERGGMQGDYRLGDREGGWEAGISGDWGWETARLGERLGHKDVVEAGRMGGLGGRLEAWEAGDWETGRLIG